MKSSRRRKRAPFGLPKDIVLVATPRGWRHSLVTSDGGFVCGHLPDLPAEADAELAKARATGMVRELGHGFHGAVLDVAWEEAGAPDSWVGRIHHLPGPQPDEADHRRAGG
ncbi:hypothetical protein [Kitasatospora sp. NBC_00458]|uniref:hypothetical protein n=1 Tax=Kitasatospora sp. NBC_00458 TaxID=2903568 RepID=UPI002E18D6D4